MKNRFLKIMFVLMFALISINAKEKKTYQELIEQLTSKKTSLRVEAVKELGTFKNPDSIPSLAPLIEDPKKNVRLAVARVLVAIGGDDIIKPLRKAFGDKEEEIRLTAVNGLSTMKRSDLLPAFTELIKDKKLKVKMAVINAISMISDAQALKPLREALQDKNAELRIAVVRSLSNYGDKALPILYESLEDRKADVKLSALNSIRRVGNESSIQPVQKTLSDSEIKIRIAAVCVLGMIGGEDAREALIKGLDDKMPIVREYICGILGALQSSSAVSVLQKIVADDSEQKVRASAAAALVEIGSVESLDTFNELLVSSYNEDKSFLVESAVSLIRQNADEKKASTRAVQEKQPPAPVVKPQAQTKQTPQAAKMTKDEKIKLMKMHYGKAAAFFKKGQYAESIEEWQNVLALDPDHAQSKRNIDRAKKRITNKADTGY